MCKLNSLNFYVKQSDFVRLYVRNPKSCKPKKQVSLDLKCSCHVQLVLCAMPSVDDASLFTMILLKTTQKQFRKRSLFGGEGVSEMWVWNQGTAVTGLFWLSYHEDTGIEEPA